jgi:hypothetical protein
MDLSAKPQQLKISDFLNIKLADGKDQKVSPAMLDTLSIFPIGDINENSEIFIFSVSCGDSLNRYLKDVLPRIKKGDSFLLANFLRHDNDLNVWTRIYKLKASYRMILVTKIYQEWNRVGKDFPMTKIHKVIDEYLSSVPLEQVYSGYDAKQAAISGIVTTAALQSIYGVTSTPVISKLK